MLLQEEMLILQWLSQYGVLTRKQLIRMLQKETATVERIIKSMKKRMLVAEISGGYYIGLDPFCRPDQRTILAVWVLLKFIKDVDPMAHYPARTRPKSSSSRRIQATRSWFCMRGREAIYGSFNPRKN